MRALLFFLVVAALPAHAGKKEAATPAVFDRFPHDRHNNYWAAKQLQCTSCHGFGPDAKPVWEKELRPLCHVCHVAELDYQPLVKSPCEACHESPPVPETHGAGWKEAHGAEARVALGECRECHKAAFCVDCHERKESLRYDVHDRTWLSVHGMAARAAPQGCDDCHVKSTCESCHRAAGGKWP